MAEYIERRTAIEHLNVWRGGCGSAVECILAEPAADVAPVVHGRWVTHYRSGTPAAEGYVSTCCDMWNKRKSPYCPNCGAKMDGGGDDEMD